MKKGNTLKSVAVALIATLFTGPALHADSGEILLKRNAHKSIMRQNPHNPIKKASSSVASSEVFRTAVLSKDSWIANQKQQFGLYEYSLSEYSSKCLKEITGSDPLDPTGGATYIGNGKYFYTRYSIFQPIGLLLVDSYILDLSDYTSKRQQGTEVNIARDLAYDPTSGMVYGCFRAQAGNNNTDYVFGKLDPEHADVERTVIVSLTEAWNALGIDKLGNLFAVTRSGGFYSVDKETGKMDLIANTGLESKYQTTGTIDDATGLFYFLTCGDTASTLYTIDTKDGAVTKVYDMKDGEQLAGMYIPEKEYPSGAPRQVTDLRASFDHVTLQGTISFTTPVLTVGGTPLMTDFNYRVSTQDGTTLADGTTSRGKSLDIPVTLTKSGSYTFIVSLSNEAGTGPETYLNQHVGYGRPVAVDSVTIRYENDRFVIGWPASEKPADEGIFEKDSVTYTITRKPDNTVVASKIKTTTYEDVVLETTELIKYRYEVVPVHRGVSGAATLSPEYLLGAVKPPYEALFNSRDAIADLTLLDANNDGRVWLLDDDHLFLYPTNVTKGDDYIFSAPMRLEAGRLYKFTAVMGVRLPQYGNKEIFEAVLATAPTKEGCIETIIEPLTYSAEKEEYSETFQVETSGKYYLAIHGISDPDSYGMFAYGMSVTAEATAESPDAPSLSALADKDGGMRVEGKVVAPTQCINGDQLSVIEKMELFRDGTLLQTYNNPAPGTSFDFSDNDISEGLHVYTAYAYNEEGRGKAAEAKAYAGINVPGAPRNAKAKEREDNRTVDITWEAPEADIDGCPINGEHISYTVARYDDNAMKWIVADTGLKKLSYTEKFNIEAGVQAFIKYGVFAETRKGKNTAEVGVAPIIPVGDPYSMPYVETFGGALRGILGEENENEGAAWEIWDKEDQDGDGRCLFYHGAIDKKGSVFTGKIHIEGKKPTFSFWYWSIPTSPEGEEIVVEINDGTGFKQVGVTPLNRGGEEQHWEKYSCSLAEYIGKDIQVRLSYITRKYVLYVDNFRIAESFNDNLAVFAIEAANKMMPGSTSEVTVTVENSGENASRAYSVDLYCNGAKAASKQMPSLKSAAKQAIEFKIDISPVFPENTEFYAVINYEDENAADNTSKTISTMIIHRDYPVVENLTGHRQDKDVLLEWTAPSLNLGDVKVTDDCEHYVPFSVGFPSSTLDNDYVGDWTMYDGDGEGSNGLAGFEHPNIARDRELSFIVFNPAQLGITARSWQPRSGHQAFVCLCAPTSPNDDWIISPTLSGKAQTISFYAKSVGTEYNEKFEFLYSKTGTDVDEFTKIAAEDHVPVEWKEYRFDIPEGAKYFAIRCVSDRQFALFVDDLTFERANPAADLQVLGYNIFRDGEKLNTEPVAEIAFTDKEQLAAHNYRVTTVYNRGESAASNEVTVGVYVGLDRGENSGISIIAGRNQILVRGAAGKQIEVFSVDGKLIRRERGKDESILNVAPGLYVVRAASKVEKVMVR